MVDILHRIGAKTTTPQAIYEALTTVDGLSAWWTRDTKGTPGEVGGITEFRFPPVGGFDMETAELVDGKRVVWRVVGESPEEWLGTTIEFDLSQDGDYTIVLFKHSGWREPVEFMYHCSTKWASFLLSLQQLVETGTGAPAPDDQRISNWH
ncbi:SRPBCC family protein [Nocardia stercoris]|uniref:SRPBCC domain-containing protein n=1 Tax=Nocardia stercoris TaxID=2483361 RepID=A0A3M2L296_9NOCA|nr:SRPBCC domain-containing protein [Nocardia stercoris]RMI30653.1 SRPBCC domain-containing protein [Nocardia stercoris]